ncbi:hypothetical protein K505DRAFT_328319 [Melanomma pulvis-pyrius CBS 109.77]|uniref:Uncharacterized protein n=1 Tax=Melanomma pulvis-pyrius CBS 109.77 TaxID=1314802 RepID=A0A6A6X068_9PLEO|nr:hypothetical protein K505DRAFT_328319 [Melanomma pulvis-pyrius CBS 109.77]
MPPKKDPAGAASTAAADAVTSTITGFDAKETRILAAAFLSQAGHDKYDYDLMATLAGNSAGTLKKYLPKIKTKATELVPSFGAFLGGAPSHGETSKTAPAKVNGGKKRKTPDAEIDADLKADAKDKDIEADSEDATSKKKVAGKGKGRSKKSKTEDKDSSPENENGVAGAAEQKVTAIKKPRGRPAKKIKAEEEKEDPEADVVVSQAEDENDVDA